MVKRAASSGNGNGKRTRDGDSSTPLVSNASGEALSLPKQLEADIKAWDSVGCHRTGTDGDRVTRQWLVSEIGSAGCEAAVDEFAFKRRTAGACSVSDGKKTVEGLAAFDGGATDSVGVTGKAGSDVGVAAFSPDGAGDGDAALEALRREAGSGLKAIVAVCGAKGLAVRNAHAAAPYGPPVLQVASADGKWLQACVDKGVEVTVKCVLKDDLSFSQNVRTKIQGSNSSLAPVVVATPRTAWFTATGERAGGVALFLNAVRHFATHRPKRSIVFVATTGHELDHLGMKRYLDADGAKDAHCFLLLGASLAAKNSKLTLQANKKQFLDLATKALNDADVDATVAKAQPKGEAAAVADAKADYVKLHGTNNLFHHPDDTFANVDLKKVQALNAATTTILTKLAN